MDSILFGLGIALLLGIGIIWLCSIGWLLAEVERPFIALAVFMVGAATILGVVHANDGFDEHTTTTTIECPR